MPLLGLLNCRCWSQFAAYRKLQFTNANTTIVNEQDIHEIDEPTIRVTRKRARAVEDEQADPPIKRRDLRREGERGLAGDYKYLQGSGDDRTSAVESRKMTGRIGGFKPMNTLDTQPHNGKGLFKSSVSYKANAKPMRQLSEFAPSKGINVPPARVPRGDGFQQTPFKKQRLANGNSKTTLSSDPIDLTQDNSQDLFNGTPVARNGGSISSERQRQNKTRESSPYSSQNREWKIVSAYTTTDPMNSCRKNNDSRTPSRASNRGPDDNSKQHRNANEQSTPSIVAAQQRPNEYDDEVQVTSSRKRLLQTDMANGINGHRKLVLQPSQPDQRAAGATLESDWQRQNSAAPTEQIQNTESRRNIEQPAEPDGYFLSYVRHSTRKAAKSPPLAKTFIRTGNEPQSMKTMPNPSRARHRMKATSEVIPTKVSSIDDSFGSVDELAGAVTVGSRASQSASPQKKTAAVSKQDNVTLPEPTTRNQTPSDLRPTRFQSSKQQATAFPAHKTDQEPSEENDADEQRIPLFMLVCRSCVKLQKGLALVWDNKDRCFFVQCDGQLLKIPGKEQLVCIGKAEARSWIEAKGRSILQVQVKGSSTKNSNGSIILQFMDSEGLSKCFDFLQWATEDNLKTLSVDAERIKGIVRNQVLEIQQDADKQKRLNAVHHAESERVASKNRKAGREARHPRLGEQIAYDNDTSGGQSTMKSRMQRSSIPESNVRLTRQKGGDISSTTSPYFNGAKPRRSSRQSKPVRPKSPSPLPPERWTRIYKPQPWAYSIIYPPKGLRRVTVDFQDLERLDEGEFLNDNVISFALRHIEENMAPEHKESVHFFNSFFYTALTTKTGRKAFNYDAVKRWTKNKDLFNFPYIVVPINIDLHWFVAIICNLPNLSRKAAGLDGDKDEGEEEVADHEVRDNDVNDGVDATEAVDADTSPKEVPTDGMDHLSLLDEDKGSDVIEFGEDGKVKPAPGVIAELEQPTYTTEATIASSKKTKKRCPPPPRSYDPDIPAIITLDSFGSTHAVETRNLKEYLSAEAEAKRGMAVDTKQFQGTTAKGIPEQTNFCDCGVYVVGYIEQFAKDPRRFVTKVLTKQLDKQSDFASFSPSAKRAEIREELLKLHEIKEAELQAKNSSKKMVMEADGVTSAASKSAEPAGAPSAAESKASLSPVKTHPSLYEHVSEPVSAPAPADSNAVAHPISKPFIDEEDDGMDVGVPLALDGHPGTGQHSRVAGSQIPTEPWEQENVGDEDEMLDHIDQADAIPGTVTLNEMPTLPKNELLDPLEKILADGPNGYRTPQEHALPNDEQNPTEQTREPKDQARREASDARNSRREVIDLGDEAGKTVEIPDSQEQTYALPPVAGQGRHTKFSD